MRSKVMLKRVAKRPKKSILGPRQRLSVLRKVFLSTTPISVVQGKSRYTQKSRNLRNRSVILAFERRKRTD